MPHPVMAALAWRPADVTFVSPITPQRADYKDVAFLSQWFLAPSGRMLAVKDTRLPLATHRCGAGGGEGSGPGAGPGDSGEAGRA
jgi:hypothetical protein